METTYDLVIIGGGSASLTAAGFATQLGVRVALVEEHRLGGDCTWTGCIPSKTLIMTAKVAHQMRTADRYGLTPIEPHVSLKSVMARVRDVVTDVYSEETPEALRADGIDVFMDAARFEGPQTLVVGEERLQARRVLIATGSRPFVAPIPGLEDVPYLTSDSLWDLEVLPKHLVVVGAGPIGCEMSQASHRLGSEVTLFASRDRLLPRDDLAAGRVIGEVFASEGVDVRYQARTKRSW